MKPLLSYLPLVASGFFLDLTNVNFGAYGPGEKIQIYGNNDGIKQLKDESTTQDNKIWSVSLFDLNSSDKSDAFNEVDLNCEIIHDVFFRNSPELLPLTNAGSHYIECESMGTMKNGHEYAIQASWTMEGKGLKNN